MKHRRINIAVAIIATLLSFLFVSCSGGSDKETGEKATKEKVTESTEPSTEMTDDIYVEITAQYTYLNSLYADKHEEGMSQEKALEYATKMSEKMDELYEEHGVTEDSFNEYSDKLVKDMETYVPIMERVSERTEELMSENKE